MKNSSNIVAKEFHNQIFKDKKQIIKVIGLCLISFIYGFIAIAAFWNPLDNFSEIPAAIFDLSQPTCLKVENGYIISDDSITDKNACYADGDYWGTLTGLELASLMNEDGIVEINKNNSSLISANFQYFSYDETQSIDNNNYFDQLIIPEQFNDNIINFLNCILSIKDIDKNIDGQHFDDWYIAYANNLKTLSGDTVNTGITSIGNSNPFYNPLNGNYEDQNISLNASLENNFLSMYFTNIFSETINQIGQQYFPKILNEYFISVSLDSSDSNIIKEGEYKTVAQSDSIKSIAENNIIKLNFLPLSTMLNRLQSDQVINELFDGNSSIDIATFENNFSDDVLNYSYFNLGDLIDVNLQGFEHEEYGIGLGKFFICIGTLAGAFIMTVVFTRKFADSSKSVLKNYLAKLTLMCTTGFVQVTLLFIGITGLGFYELGPYLLLLYLWILFTMLIFINVITGLWFLIRDETFAKLSIMILIVISITSCGGIFPTVMQSGFFQFVGYLSPFLYSLNGQGVIIYGISVLGPSLAYAKLMLVNFGYLLIFSLIFNLVAYFGLWKNHRVRLFGTCSANKINSTIKDLEWTHLYKIDKNQKIDFLKITSKEAVEIKTKLLVKYPKVQQKLHFFRDITDREGS